ncbi:MAG: glycosyltransferase family 4 protein [Candidatus Sumerlaeaceae bacterium]
MKIALVAPFEEPVPPRTYGGTELVVYNLAEQLVTLGHDVAVYASGDSNTSARLEPIFPISLRADRTLDTPELREAMKMIGIGRLVNRLNSEDFDIIHNHLGWRLLAFAGQLSAPVITTFHGPLSVPYYQRVLGEIGQTPFVSISNAQRRPFPGLNYIATVYNGIDCASFQYNEHPKEYFAFLGRFSPEKGPVTAIRAAQAANVSLIMAGKVDLADRDYFAQQVEPLIDGQQIRFIGEVNHAQKNELLQSARAILIPIDWEEPFGLVMIEALATGTPVIAHRRGSVPEIIEQDVGCVTDSFEQMVEAIGSVHHISRARCREYACDRFGCQAMAQGYLAAYEKILEGDPQPNGKLASALVF